MSWLNKNQTKRLVAIHGWSGVVLGLLLYVVIVTGALAVFEKEIGVWSKGGINNHQGLGEIIDHYFRKNSYDVDRSYYDKVIISKNDQGQYRYSFQKQAFHPGHNHNETKAVEIIVDTETGKVISKWEGFFVDRVRGGRDALRRFIVYLHIRLHLPNPYGLILTGILGLMMMAAAISGILIHKHLIKDMFLPVRGDKRLLTARDRHILAGTWSLPFAILLAFTGVFFSFALSIGIPLLAMVAFDGNQQAIIETVMGPAKEIDKTTEPLASLNYIAHDAIKRTGGIIKTITIHNFDTVSAIVDVNIEPKVGGLSNHIFGYDGVSGKFLIDRPLFGQVPSIGSSLVQLMSPLHFGNFAGIASKLVWFFLGLAMAYVTASGLLLWTKRREELKAWQGFYKAVLVTIWGLPIAILCAAYGFFLMLPAGNANWWTPFCFCVSAILIIIYSFFKASYEKPLVKLFAKLLVGLPFLRQLTGGVSWSESLLTAGQGEVIIIDIILLIGGLFLILKNKKMNYGQTSFYKAETAE